VNGLAVPRDTAPLPSFAVRPVTARAVVGVCVWASITVCAPPFIEIPTDSNRGIGARPEIVPVSELPADTEEGERASGTETGGGVAKTCGTLTKRPLTKNPAVKIPNEDPLKNLIRERERERNEPLRKLFFIVFHLFVLSRIYLLSTPRRSTKPRWCAILHKSKRVFYYFRIVMKCIESPAFVLGIVCSLYLY
jgi:hypothetical protein